MREEAMLPDTDWGLAKRADGDGKEGSCPSIVPAPDEAH
jgi:hypothetical protein